MSKIGKRIINIPAKTEASVHGNTITVKGPKGTLTWEFSPIMNVSIANNEITTSYVNFELQKNTALWGTTNAIIANMVIGVNEGYKKELEIRGVGYRAALIGKQISLDLGFSHKVVLDIPTGITVVIPKPVNIIVSGIDKEKVSQFAALIRKHKKPEPYLGKGIRYINEVVIKKEGKAAGK